MLLLLLSACPEPVVESDGSTATVCDACNSDCLEEFIPADSKQHVDGPDYEDKPPTGGDHDGCWAAWGVHEDPVSDENWVHNLEHGGVVFLYDCPNGCAADVAEVASYVESVLEGTAMLTPYANLSNRFAAVAWENRIQMGCLDLTALGDFYEKNQGHAPENVLSEPSSSCTLGDSGTD
jgi:hypothetical protein